MKTLLTIAFIAATLGLFTSIALLTRLLFHKKRVVKLKTIHKN